MTKSNSKKSPFVGFESFLLPNFLLKILSTSIDSLNRKRPWSTNIQNKFSINSNNLLNLFVNGDEFLVNIDVEENSPTWISSENLDNPDFNNNEGPILNLKRYFESKVDQRKNIIFYNILKPIERLPVYQPASVNSELVDTTIVHKINYHKISDFTLTNQNGETVTQKKYDNKIYVADFFFTTCQSICPIMTKNMKDIQDKLIKDSEVLLLSHTVFPEIDSVEVLKKYAVENQVIDSKWDLVTGDKKEIYDLARKSYLAAKDNSFGEYEMIHTENFVLIDKKKQIRGFYDGTDPKAIETLLDDIKVLKATDNHWSFITFASLKWI